MKPSPTLKLPLCDPPVLIAVVDTEEQFDWQDNFDRNATDVSALGEFSVMQTLYESFGITPVYVLDYPMATTRSSIEILRALHNREKAELGIHLHTWVNPPFDEQVSSENSYQKNLPPALEFDKLTRLCTAFEQAFGFRPTVHKAGRYGLGEQTLSALSKLGIRVDLSVASAFDFSLDGGPDYAACLPGPRWMCGGILGIPTTGAFIGPMKRFGPKFYSASAQSNALPRLAAKVFSKTRAIERIMLSPEGHSLEKLKRLTMALFRRGERVFTFSLHSSTARPGATVYVDTPDELQTLLTRCRQYFEFFFHEFGGVAMTATQAHEYICKRTGTPFA